MRKSFVLIVPTLFSLFGCGSEQKSQNIKISFYNYDGSLLWQTSYIEGQSLTYGGDIPTRKDDGIYSYTFSGWNHELSQAGQYRSYYAQYNKDFRQFDVSFHDSDGKIIKTVKAKYGDNIVDKAPTNIIKKNEEKKHYYFQGWKDVDLTYVASSLLCYPSFLEVNCYEVSYYDYDNTLLKSEIIEENKSAEYTYRNYYQSGEELYSFSYWDVSLDEIKEDVTAHAIYRAVKAYTVSFLNYDGKELYQCILPKGFDAVYKGETPTRAEVKEGYYTYRYTFEGWDASLDNVQNNFKTTAKYKTSTFYHNPDYEGEVQKLKNKALSGTYDSEEGVYLYGYYMNVTTLNGGVGYIYYDQSRDSVYFHATTYLYVNGSLNGGAFVNLYFNNSRPGTYSAYYKYVVNGSTSFIATFDITSSYSSSSSIVFTDYTDWNGKNILSNQLSIAKGLVDTSLSEASKESWLSMYKLGFNNY